EARKLVGWVDLKGDESGAITIRLRPWGVLSGRVIDDEGQPRKSISVHSRGGIMSIPKPDAAVLPAPNDGRFLQTDGEGRLHGGGGLAARPGEVRRDLKDGPDASIARVLAGKSREGRVPEGFEATAGLLGDSAVASGDPARLKAWWVFRMLLGPDPLGERLTL